MVWSAFLPYLTSIEKIYAMSVKAIYNDRKYLYTIESLEQAFVKHWIK